MANLFREKLASGRRLLGTHVNLTDYHICEMLGSIGFDYLWIDMEHCSINFNSMEMHLIAAKAAGTPTLVRVPWNDIPDIKRVLETGPDAVLIPMIDSVEEAKRAIDTCIYPPEGKRGYGPSRAICYGIDDAREYVHGRYKEMLRFLQIESKNAIMELEEIAGIPYVDGFILGPNDLSGSVGIPCEWWTEEVDRLIDLAIEKAHRCGKPIGLSAASTDPEILTHWFQKDVDFISAGTDINYIVRGSRENLATMRRLDGECGKQQADF